MQANRNGFFYVLNRETGKLVAANKFVDRVDWAESIDLETGKPNQTEVAEGARTGDQVEFWPSAFGGKNWSPISYDPEKQTAFVNTINVGMNYKAVEPQYRAGVFYFGAEFSWSWPEGNRGFLRALAGLQRVAEAIGEHDENERCAIFLRQLDPAWPPADL